MPKTKELKIPIKTKQNLEDCQPGASRSGVLNALRKVANSPKIKISKNG